MRTRFCPHLLPQNLQKLLDPVTFASKFVRFSCLFAPICLICSMKNRFLRCRMPIEARNSWRWLKKAFQLGASIIFEVTLRFEDWGPWIWCSAHEDRCEDLKIKTAKRTMSTRRRKIGLVLARRGWGEIFCASLGNFKTGSRSMTVKFEKINRARTRW